MIKRFHDRTDAGKRLADRLVTLLGQHPSGDVVVVLALPRGGVPVAYEVARALHAPLDVLVVRKLGVPFQPEVAMGAIGEDGVRFVDDDVVRAARVSEAEVAQVEAHESVELARRVRTYRGDRGRLSLLGRTVVIVDDGIATGATAKVACRVARVLGARHVVLAVPVAPADWVARVGDDADVCVAVETPQRFAAVGEWYQRFDATTDVEVTDCLARMRRDVAGEQGT